MRARSLHIFATAAGLFPAICSGADSRDADPEGGAGKLGRASGAGLASGSTSSGGSSTGPVPALRSRHRIWPSAPVLARATNETDDMGIRAALLPPVGAR